MSEMSDLVSGHVRCCPVLSDTVTSTLYMVLKHYQNTLSARAKGCVAELWQNCGRTVAELGSWLQVHKIKSRSKVEPVF